MTRWFLPSDIKPMAPLGRMKDGTGHTSQSACDLQLLPRLCLDLITSLTINLSHRVAIIQK